MTANLWQSYSILLPLADAGSSTVDMLSYDATLSRVRINVAVCATNPDTAAAWPAGSTWLVQRSTDLIRWTTVRGGTAVTVDADALPLDDYEFDADVNDQYRVQVWSESTLLWTFTDSITPVLGLGASQAWLKDIAAPYRNRIVTIASADDITYGARVGLFDIVGAALPVAVTDVRGGQAYNAVLAAADTDEDASVKALLSSGNVLFLQASADFPLDSGYYSAADVVRSWRGAPPTQNPRRRWWTLPLTEVAAPAADVVGSTNTWVNVAATYATWNDVVAAYASWNELVDTVADSVVG